MASTALSFKLDDSFVEEVKKWDNPFNGNKLGEIVYQRTYSRVKSDDTNEEFYETVRRVVEGCFSDQKDHINKLGKNWDDVMAQRSAQEMFERMFKMKFLPPGRGLWVSGTPVHREKKLGMAANNCAFLSTENILDNPTRPFTVLMDMSMCGTGVGFDTKGADKVKLYEPILTPNQLGLTYFTVPDTREGWVMSLEILLNSYFIEDSPDVVFDYDEIRPKGEKLKTFGGVSSGPAPLIELHNKIREVMSREMGKGSGLTSTGITDICNLIGVCVVSGGVRRTALIGFGESDDKEFLDLKNYDKNPHRMSYGWTSNNSIFAQVGQDYTDIQDRICKNGEPGLAWLGNMQKYSRMCDPPDWKDRRARGGNPCFSIDTSITTSEGLRQIKDLLGKKFTAVIDGKEYPSTDEGFFLTAENQQLYKLELENGLTVRATANHKFVTPEGLVELENLEIDDDICLSDNTDYKWKGGIGTEEEGYLMGNLISDGTFNGIHGTDDVPRAFISMWINKDVYDDPKEYEPYRYIQNIATNVLTHRNNSNFKGLKLAREKDKTWEYRLSMVAINEMAQKFDIKPREKKIPENGSYEFTKGLLQALFDFDGTVNPTKGHRTIRIRQNNLSRLESIQRLLYLLGIGSKIYKNRQKEGMRSMPDGKGGMKDYYCKSCHDLNISGDNIIKYQNIIGFKDNAKKERLEEACNYKKEAKVYEYISKVKSITEDKIENVYCSTIPGPHIFVAGGIKARNCLEQS